MGLHGHSTRESVASKGAALAAVLVALFPTSCDGCDFNLTAIIHSSSAAVLFSILAFFCFGPFRKNTKGQGGKKERRSKIYLTCGWLIVGAMLTPFIAKLVLSNETMTSINALYWAEAIALSAFGVAWIVAGKYFSLVVDEDEALRLFRE